MSDESYSFSTARVRLEEIVTQVRKKDTSLEKSLDLLEEGVRLANACTELIDHADWTVGGVGEPAEGDDATQVVAEGAPSDEAEETMSEDAPEAPEVEALSEDAHEATDDEA